MKQVVIDYDKIDEYLDKHFPVKFNSNVDYDKDLRSWFYSSKLNKFRISYKLPEEFIEELSMVDLGLLFYLIYNIVPLGEYGHEGYLFDMRFDSFKDGQGRGVSRDTYYSFRNKLLHYGIVFKVNKFPLEDGSYSKVKYFFNPRYLNKNKPVVTKGKERPTHEYMSNFKNINKPDFGINN
jgi:hypothetical protein